MIEHKIDDIIIYNTSRISDNIKREDISDCIAKWVVDNLEKELVSEIFERNYEGFSTTDKTLILIRTNECLNASKNKRIYDIKTATDEYLKENKSLNLIGFIRFRLQKYKDRLKNTIDSIIEKYLVEREYEEFINLIKEYLIYQESFLETLNIFIRDSKYIYRNDKGEDISALLEETFIIDDNLSENDKILTILILCNPKKVIWHLSGKTENKELLKTVTSIFEKRVEICAKCERCAPFDRNRLDNL